MSQKEKIEALLTEQVKACIATITGNSNPARGYRRKVRAAELVAIPSSLTAPPISPKPIEIEREVIKEVPGPEVTKKVVVKETNLTVLVAAVIISLCVGAGAGAAFF